MIWKVNVTGWLVAEASVKVMPRPMLEHGTLKTINGIIVHQTDSDRAEQTLNSYKSAKANGAHFLIGKDGVIYQVASLKRKTWHVGKLRSKCLALHSCEPAELEIFKAARESPKVVNRIEMRKSVPVRYPSNEDSIGIEIVGRCVLPKSFDKPNLSVEQRKKLIADRGVFEDINPAQNRALKNLIVNLTELLHIIDTEVYPHSTVSRKNITEAVTAQWK